MYRALRFLLTTLLCALATAAQADTPAELVARGREAMGVDPRMSREFAERALEQLLRRPDPALQLRARALLCDHDSERDLQSAQTQAAAMRALLPAVRTPGLEAAVLLCEGAIEESRGDGMKAMALFERAVEVAERAGDRQCLADALYQRAYLRGVRGELAAGLTDMRRAISLYEQLQQEQQARNALNGVAILYNRMGDAAQARHYYETSLARQEARGKTRETLVTLHNLGRVLENLGDWNGAQQAFENALQLARRLDYPRGEAYALRGLASVRNARGTPAEALALLDLAEPIRSDTPDERLHAQLLQQRGIALRLSHRPLDAVQALEQALAIFGRADAVAEQVAVLGELSLAHGDAGEWRTAYERQAAFKQASDRMLQRQLDQRFASLKVEFDSATKDKENALLQREKAAADEALRQEQRVGRLKLVVLLLAAALLSLLGGFAWRQHRAGRRMRELAMTDELTGLPNRRQMLARLDTMLAAGARAGALLIIDLDHFKRINDQRGHLVGDDILRAVSASLRAGVQPPASAGRLGGEEFVVVVPRADVALAAEVAERLRTGVEAIDTTRWSAGAPLAVTVSIGLTVVVDGDDASSVLRRADEALYAAKAAGRNRVIARSARAAALDAVEAGAVIEAARQGGGGPSVLPTPVPPT